MDNGNAGEKGPSLTRWCRYKLLEMISDNIVLQICQELQMQNGQSLSRSVVDLVRKKVTEIFEEDHEPGNLKGEMTSIFVSTLKNSVSNMKDTKGMLRVLVDENDPELVQVISSALKNAKEKNSGDDVEGFKTAFVEEPVQLILDKPRTMTANPQEINQKPEIDQGQKKGGGKSKGRSVKKTRKVRKSGVKTKTKYIPKKRRYALYSRKKMVGGQSETELQDEKTAKIEEIKKTLNAEKETKIQKINSEFDTLKSQYDADNSLNTETKNTMLKDPTEKRDSKIKALDEEYNKKINDQLKTLEDNYADKLTKLQANAKRLIEFNANKAVKESDRAANKAKLAGLQGVSGSIRRGLSSVVDVGRGASDAAGSAKYAVTNTFSNIPSLPGKNTRKAIGQGLSSAGTTMKNVGSKGLTGLGSGAKILGKTAVSGVGALGTGAKFLGKGLGALGSGAISGLGALGSGAASLAGKAFSKKDDDGNGDGGGGGGGDGDGDGPPDEEDADALMEKYQVEIIEKLAAQLDGTVDKIKQRVLTAITDIITKEKMQQNMRHDIHTQIMKHSGFSPNLKEAFVQSIFKQNQGTFAQALDNAIKELGKNKKPPDFTNSTYMQELSSEIMKQLKIIMVNV